MKTLTIAISDIEYNKFGITDETVAFSDIIDLVHKEMLREQLNASVNAAASYGLSILTMDDITSEVQATRSAKNHT